MEAVQENSRQPVQLLRMLWKWQKNLDKNIPVEWSSKKLELVDYRSAKNRFFVRVSGTDKASVEKIFGNVDYIDAQGVTGELGFVTEEMTEEALENKKQHMGKC